MCFSPESSFTSAVFLAGLTYAVLKQVKSKNQHPLAIIPAVFALVQLMEGFIWLALDYQFYPSIIIPMGTYFLLFIAHFYWLFITPLICFLWEPNVQRKKILKGILVAASLIIAVVLCLDITAPQAPSLNIVNHSIHYSFSTFDNYPLLDKMQGYVVVFLILAPFCVTSLPWRYKWGMFFAIAIPFVISYYFYYYAFLSVWCFFAATASIAVLALIHGINKLSLHQR